MRKALLVLFTEDGLPAVPWAARVAEAFGEALAILCVRREPERRLDEVGEPADGTPPLARAVLERSGADGAKVYDCRGPHVRRAVLDAARELDACRLILPAHAADAKDGSRAEVRRLARAAPYDVFVIDAGEVDGGPRRVLVPQLAGGGAHAIRFAARGFGGPGVAVLALADPEAAARSTRVFGRVRERVADEKRDCLQAIAPGASIPAKLEELVAPGDLVLIDAEQAGSVPRIAGLLSNLRKAKPDVAFAVGITRSGEAAGPGRIERMIERVRLHAPTLSRDERRDLHDFLERGGKLSLEFVVMLMLSASIAALGLIQSSTAVVIGAMLVAPLMTPLVAAGMSLAQANAALFRSALRAMAIGTGGALLASAFIGMLSPWSDLSAEVVARGAPNPFDLGIALLSGIAAAFALARPGLTGTLVGVAIAVALVPPLAAVGIATVKGEFGVVLGAAVLFVTNLLAIVTGAALVFRFFGLDASRRGSAAPRWVRLTMLGIVLALIPTTALLARNLAQQIGEGVHRPYARPLPPALREALHAHVATEPGLRIVMMAQSDIEHGFGVEIVLSSAEEVDAALTESIQAIVERHLGDRRRARIHLLRAIR